MSSGIVQPQSGQEQSPQQQGGSVSRARLVQRLLAASANLPAFVQDLLTTQAVVVVGTEAAAFIIEPRAAQQPEAAEGAEPGAVQPAGFELKTIAHIRPDNSTAETRAAAISAFQEIVRPCVEQGKDGAIQVSPENETHDPQFCLVTLLRSEGNVVAVSAVITRCRDQERATQRLMSMELVAGYFELFTLRRTSEQSRVIAQSHQHVLQLASSVATAEGFDSASMNLCNELATRTGAVRVSLGWVKHKASGRSEVKLKALSHTEQFDKKQELAVQLCKTMEECADQDDIVQFDPTGEASQNVTREAQALSRMSGGNTILSLPLRRKDEVVGVIALEFAPNTKIAPQSATGLAVAVELLAPQLYDRFQNDRWLITKAGISAKDTLKLVTGPKHMLAKTLIVVGLLGLLFITFYRPTYHVSAPFQFEAIDRRAFSVPFDSAQLQEVKVRPGDRVAKGDVLLKFATHELEMQKYKYQSDARAAALEAAKYATDDSKLAERNMARANQEAAQAMAEYFGAQIEKAVIKAPFDGIILSGDLKDRVNSVFKQGEPLMEIGASNSLRVEISVAERDIQEVINGAKGTLATSSFPEKKFPFVVDRIVPMSDAKEGGNFFKVYGRLEKSSDDWRPGMAGEAKIQVGNRSLAWIWTHRFTDWVRMLWWKYVW
jgi:multidrug resistance efflux pump